MERLFLECTVRAALIAIVTAIVLRTMGIQPAAARHTAWTSVMLTMLVLPVWSAWGPKASIRLLPAAERHASIATPLPSIHPDSVGLTNAHPFQASAPPPTGPNWTWPSLLLMVYGVGAVGLLARLTIGTARTHRLKRRANVRDGKGISSECACPITIGWLHPAVILPQNWQEWSPQQLDAVLTHEREHVRRRDPLIQWLALLNRALFWFHPLSWWLERKLSLLAEEACDAAVLANGHTPEDYSEYLLNMARAVSCSGSRLGIVGMAMPGSFLRQRIRQIHARVARPISRTKVVVAVTACAMSSALLASGTLDHARIHVPLGTTDPVHSSISQSPAPKSEVVLPADHELENPRVLMAQTTTAPIAPEPIPPPAQQAAAAPPSDPAEKERQLQDAFLRSDPITDITVSMEINYFQLNKAEYFVPLTVKIPGSELSLARNGGAQRTSFDLLGQIKDEFGSTVHNTRDRITVNLDAATTTQLASTPVTYDAGFALLPGRYSIKLLVRDNETGRMGAKETSFTVPNLNKEQQGIPISSVVLSSQRVAIPGAFNDGNKPQTANPLVADGQKLIPSVTRVFRKSGEMYVYLQAYQREGGSMQPLFASATFYQGQTKVWETAPIEVTQGMNPKSRAIPFNLTVSLADLKPGDYTCQIAVWSPITQKNALWQAPVVIEP